MQMSKTRTILSRPLLRPLVAVAAFLFFGAAHGQSITKCQDAEGNWHYGDFAAEACAEESTVTEIDERGLKINESEAPPTQEELDARKAAEQREQEEVERRARQEKKDRRLLQTYDSTQAIVTAREQRVQALERDLESHRLFRQDLVDEKQALENSGENGEHLSEVGRQIEQYDQAIQKLEQERQSTIEEYNEDLERYRELTGE